MLAGSTNIYFSANSLKLVSKFTEIAVQSKLKCTALQLKVLNIFGFSLAYSYL